MTSTKVRKRKRLVDSASVYSEDNCTIMERYNPTSTFTSFNQVIDMLREFLKMCHNNDSGIPNHISDSVYNIVSIQVNVLESLMRTVQDHMK